MMLNGLPLEGSQEVVVGFTNFFAENYDSCDSKGLSNRVSYSNNVTMLTSTSAGSESERRICTNLKRKF